MSTVADIVIGFVAIYPIVTGAFWIAGGLMFQLFDEREEVEVPADGWPPVTVLIPAFNEERVIGRCVQAALAVDYPRYEVIVLDDGSSDRTAKFATAAGDGDPRLRVIPDEINRGKAERLNIGFKQAQHDLVVVTDADTHLHPAAFKMMVSRMLRSERIAAVAGGPHVTNRYNLFTSMQLLEATSTIGLIRRTQSLAGSVGTVAGVLGLFRRQAVLDVGGYNDLMSTEDIDLSWRLLMAGWMTVYEPAALIGMQVPGNLKSLWAQRKRWARGQGEVIRHHALHALRWRHRSLWPVLGEGIASLFWVTLIAIGVVLTVLNLVTGNRMVIFEFGLVWGIAIAVVATIQLAFALQLNTRYDRIAALAFVLAPIYPIAYWMLNAAAAVRAELIAIIRGPRKRVVWDIPRETSEP